LFLGALACYLAATGPDARAAFSITTTLTSPSDPMTALTVSPHNLTNALTPAPAGGIGFNFLDINYAGSSATLGPVSFTVTGTFTIDNGGVTGTGSFSETFTYTLVNGFGTLAATAASITPTVAGINFSPTMFASPTFADGQPSSGNLSTVLTTAAVPEPSSLALCGVAGVAGLAVASHRRKRA
jgi:hypothetical protein